MSDPINTDLIRKTEVSRKSFVSSVEGVIVILTTLGYIAIVFFLLGLWSDKAGEIVLGFALFAQSVISKYFDMHREQTRQEKPPVPGA